MLHVRFALYHGRLITRWREKLGLASCAVPFAEMGQCALHWAGPVAVSHSSVSYCMPGMLACARVCCVLGLQYSNVLHAVLLNTALDHIIIIIISSLNHFPSVSSVHFLTWRQLVLSIIANSVDDDDDNAQICKARPK